MRKSVAYMPNVMQAATRQAVENCDWRNRLTGSNGALLLSSTITNPTIASVAATIDPTTGAVDQPQCEPSMKANAKVASAITAKTCPGMSILRRSSLRLAAITFHASTQASAANGTVTRKMPRQPT